MRNITFGTRVIATRKCTAEGLIPGDPGVVLRYSGNPTPYLVAFKNLKHPVWCDREDIKIYDPIPGRARVYICSQYGGKEENLVFAERYAKFAMKRNRVPIVPHVFYHTMLDDNYAPDREVGLRLGIELLDICRELWVFEKDGLSAGMRAEIEAFGKTGRRIRVFRVDDNGEIHHA